jgi:hypothetical protein
MNHNHVLHAVQLHLVQLRLLSSTGLAMDVCNKFIKIKMIIKLIFTINPETTGLKTHEGVRD